ncbi:MAG: hypothetical protein IPH38_18500 [Candidatus Microthrix sp.]|nr:hypothetical protein [Candidatus Microthrix sp.]MBK7021525.1 hypothetical protein [Candidatus Microthrix sp.]
MARFIVVAARSGLGVAGWGTSWRTSGWFVIDNLPPSLVPKGGQIAARSSRGSDLDRIALVVGPATRNGRACSMPSPGLRDWWGGRAKL